MINKSKRSKSIILIFEGEPMKKENISTKEMFMDEALRLFAERGYDAVSVSEIADAVGCSAPALYKHFSGKRDLFDAILERSEHGFKECMRRFKLDFESFKDNREYYLKLSEREFVRNAKAFFSYSIHEEMPGLFRKMMTIEQFHMPELASIYDRRYIESLIDVYTAYFKLLMENGKMKKTDAKTLAVGFMSVPVMMLNMCDRDPSKEDWALKMIEKHIKEFNKTYRI